MSLLSILTRRPKETLVTTDTEANPEPTIQEPQSEVVMRFLTTCGATVEVLNYPFETRYTWQGRPYTSNEMRQVDGFIWVCQGCRASGSTDGSTGPRGDYGRYLPDELDLARKDANRHAGECRAMPKPTA